MVDREKVIKGLECCMSEKICASQCPYKGQCDDGGYYYSRAIEEAISMLKSQEPKPPRFTVAYDKIFYACDNCGKSLVVIATSEGLVLQKDLPKYCPGCGQAVKWDG